MSAHRKCSAVKKNGQRCGGIAIDGGTVCHYHGGAAPQVKAHAAVRSELTRWTLGDPVDNPGETLLRLITQSRMRADLYGELLQQAYDAAERIAADSDGGVLGQVGVDARRDLEHVLQIGGVSALIGKTYGAAGKDGVVYATGEAVRGLAQLEAAERDRCARFCKLAIDAGLAERMVRLAEKQAALAAEAFRAALAEAGIEPDVVRQVMAGAGRHLRLVAS